MSRRPTPEVVIRCQGRRIAQYTPTSFTRYFLTGGMRGDGSSLGKKARRQPLSNSRIWDNSVPCWGCDSGSHALSEERLAELYAEAKRQHRTINVSVTEVM